MFLQPAAAYFTETVTWDSIWNHIYCTNLLDSTIISHNLHQLTLWNNHRCCLIFDLCWIYRWYKAVWCINVFISDTFILWLAVHVNLSFLQSYPNYCAVDGNYVLNCFLSSIIIPETTLSKHTHTHTQISGLTPDTDDNPTVISVVNPSLVSACLSFPPHLSPWPPDTPTPTPNPSSASLSTK